MSLDLSSALREAADHAPLGTLEPSVLGRRIRHRRAARAAAGPPAASDWRGVLAVTATQTPGLLDRVLAKRARHIRAVTGLPADQVATTLPTAETGRGTRHVRLGRSIRPAAASPLEEAAVALGTYPEETYSRRARDRRGCGSRRNVTFRSVIGVVVAK